MTQALARTEADPPPPRRRPKMRTFGPKRWEPRGRGFYLILTATAVLALWIGLLLRQWAWRASRFVHFRWDLNNAWRWGTYTLSKKKGHLSGLPALAAAHDLVAIFYPVCRHVPGA